MHKLDLFVMKKKPGVIAVGMPERDPHLVFEDITDALFRFYDEEGDGRIFVPQTKKTQKGIVTAEFDKSVKRYQHIVYTGEMPFPGQEAERYSHINMKYYGKKLNIGEILKDCDFPQGISISNSEKFGIYFDTINSEDALRKLERDHFIRYHDIFLR